MRRYGILAACLLMAAAVAAANDDAADPGRALVELFVTDVETLASRFEQSLIDAEGAVVEVTTGSLEIQRPGRFRWSYVEPYEQILIADGLNMWSYDVDLAQVTVKPQAEALSNTPALLLGGSAEVLEQFEFGATEEADGTTWVVLTPKNTESGFLQVDLGFTDGQLDRMVFYDNLEQTTVVNLFEAVINSPIAADRFAFEVPEDVDLIGIPAVAHLQIP